MIIIRAAGLTLPGGVTGGVAVGIAVTELDDLLMALAPDPRQPDLITPAHETPFLVARCDDSAPHAVLPALTR